MIGCGRYEILIARYLDGESLLQDREELERHLSACPDCERLYRELADVDRLLREYPEKSVEPPPHLHGRILSSLPEIHGEPARTGWGWWAAGLGTAAAGILALAIGLQRGGAPRGDRVASVPPAVVQPAVPAPHGGEIAAPPQTSQGRAGEVPALSADPEGRRRREGTAVAAAPKVQVIREVRIFFYYPAAERVAVTGDFNGWDLQGTPLKASGKPGLWETELRVPPGVYSYNFIVDGDLLVPDPNSPNQMPDGYGGTNSVLLVRGESAI